MPFDYMKAMAELWGRGGQDFAAAQQNFFANMAKAVGQESPSGVPRAGVFEAGLSGVELWRAIDNRPPRKLLSTRKRAIRVRLLRGHRYRFFTIGVDKAGNRELPPRLPDVQFRVARR